jgi:hypothetical protein
MNSIMILVLQLPLIFVFLDCNLTKKLHLKKYEECTCVPDYHTNSMII